jgi:LacI family transcriptional regulator
MNKIKEVTIYDIASKLNISVATVSRGLKDDKVVNKKTRKKISDLAFCPESPPAANQYNRCYCA